MRYVVDAEYTPGPPSALVSIALLRDGGETYYATTSGIAPAELARDACGFARDATEFWADDAVGAWLALSSLAEVDGTPDGWPTHCNSTRQLAAFVGSPEPPAEVAGSEHHLHGVFATAAWLRRLEARRHAASWYDPTWRSVLTTLLTDTIFRMIDWDTFTAFTNFAFLDPGHGPALLPSAPLVVADPSSDGGFALLPPASTVDVPVTPLEFEVTLDGPALAGWGLGEIRPSLVTSAAHVLQDGLWSLLECLVSHAPTAGFDAVAALEAEIGGASLVDVEFPGGTQAVLHQPALVLTVVPLVATEALSAEGDSWTYRATLPVCAALTPSRARRLLAAAPGGLILPVPGVMSDAQRLP